MPSGQAPSAPKSQTPSTRYLKATEAYTYPEAAKAMRVHKTAIRRWAREGLKVDASMRPHLVRGDELIRFCNARRAKRRKKSAFTEFFCLKCRKPSKPYEMLVDLTVKPNGRLMLEGVCSVCDARAFKLQSVKNLPKIAETFVIQKVAGEHLMDCVDPNLKSHLDGHI